MIEYIYLASQFGRQAEMRSIRDRLEKNPKVKVVAQWIDEKPFDHEPTEEEISMISNRDLGDVMNCDTFVLFNPPPYLGDAAELSRGGRLYEAGFAAAIERNLIVVGEHENIHLHEDWKHFETVEDLLNEYRS